MAYNASKTRYENMKYNKCGESGLKLPTVSLGLWHNFGANGACLGIAPRGSNKCFGWCVETVTNTRQPWVNEFRAFHRRRACDD